MDRATTRPIHLTFKSVEQVVVEPDDNDRFVTTAAEAARACQQAESAKGFLDAFRAFLSYIHEWCVANSEKVEAGYVDVGDGGLRVNICTFDEDFDFRFDDEVTELDIQLAEKFPTCIAEVTQIPRPVCQQMNLDAEFSIMVYGDSERTSQAG